LIVQLLERLLDRPGGDRRINSGGLDLAKDPQPASLSHNGLGSRDRPSHTRIVDALVGDQARDGFVYRG
jgi:hypothetical protein